ncbi:trypsin-like serine protease [Psychrobacter cryohalolentis]|uniref:trypsin-like serine protease n=1 Tax=Psychrobacter sp. D2 TaxID=2759702 RepID=UPI0015E5A6AE|nr:trypsin-like serine protease [Psychrobacter sp. D2]MBA2056312.1 trypsin-like serine protease [Psychrobacter sp. D2]
MKSKMFQISLLVASIFTVSSMAHAETISIDAYTAENYSKDFNVSVQEAERRLAIQSQLDYITKKLHEQFGDTIASVYFDNGLDFKLVVRTTKKGNAQKQVIDLTNQLSKQYELPIEVIANSPRNFKAIENIIENQKARIAKQYSGFQMIGYQPQRDAIRVAFYEPDVSKQNEIKAKLQKISGMPTILEFIPNPIENTAGTVGGGSIRYSSGVGYCSGGFTGTMNGKLGVLTATHCIKGANKSVSSYVNTNTVNQAYSLPNGEAIVPPSQYHEISFLPLNTTSLSGSVQRSTVYPSTNPDLTIKGLGSAQGPTIINGQNVAGTYLCHTGDRTGFSCGNVTVVSSYWGGGGCNTSVINNTNPLNVCYPSYIVVEGPSFRINQGDSGGPLFDSSGKAHGIASAMYSLNSGIFSSMSYLSNFTLKTER